VNRFFDHSYFPSIARIAAAEHLLTAINAHPKSAFLPSFRPKEV